MKPGPLLFALLALCGGSQGCKQMFYPAARAFGGPSESELKLRRIAFEHLKAIRKTAKVLVYPAFQPVDPSRGAYPGTAKQAVALLQEFYGFTNCTVAQSQPSLAATPMMHNQMRYKETRAQGYAEWAKLTRPEADFLLIIELLSPPSGGIVGIQCYVLESSGQVAYARQLNNHHFGTGGPGSPANAVGFVLQVLFQDLQRPADQVHPPYGVG